MDARFFVLCYVVCFSLLTSSCGGAGGDTTPVAAAQAGKVFALMDPGDTASVLGSFAANDAVAGLAFRSSWRILEPQDGVYDWSTLDTAFDTVRAYGKQLTLHVGAGSVGLPNWLAGLGVVMYSYQTPTGATVTDPVPWDATYLSRYTAFVSALAAHIQSRGDGDLLYAVSDAVPVAEMSILGCQNGVLEGGIAYSRASYLAAWKMTVSAYVSAFPATRLFISAPVSVICNPDNDGKSFYTELMNYALNISTHINIFAADLNATGSARLMQADTTISDRADIALQMIWSATDDTQNRMKGTLQQAVCEGIQSGAGYFEIYKADISNTDVNIQNAIQLARIDQPC